MLQHLTHPRPRELQQMNYSIRTSKEDIRLWGLESKLLKRGFTKDYIGEYCRVKKGDTRSLDYRSC